MSDLTSRLASLSPEKRAMLLAQLKKKQEEKKQELILPQKRETNEVPLSFAQQRLWFLNQLEPQGAFYNISSALHISGHVHVKALDRSLTRVIQRHEVLRTTFEEQEGHPVQIITPSVSPRLHQSLSVIDLSSIDLACRDQLAHDLARQEAAQPFSLAKGPLLRVALLRLDLEEHLLVLTMHHVVSDGWSMGILQREIARLFQAEAKGEAGGQAQGIVPTMPEVKGEAGGQAQGAVPTVGELPVLPIQYTDYALWQRKFLQGTVLQEQIDYWQHHLAGAPGILHLPTDRPHPPIQTYAGDKQMLLVPPALVEELKALSQREETTLFMTMLAAFNVLLMRYSGQQDIVVGVPIANRTRSELKDLIGFFVNTLAVRTDLSGHPSFRHLLARVRDVALQAFAHQDLPFEKLVEVLPVERHLGYSPLFQVLFVMQNVPQTSLEAELTQSGLSWRTVEIGQTTAKFDLECYVSETSLGLEIVFIYNIDLFSSATIKRLLVNFQTLLKGIAQNPQAPIWELPLLTQAELHQQLVEWNATKTDYQNDVCVHQLFEQQVERMPDAVAVTFEETCLSYRQLGQYANQLAHLLRNYGIGPDCLVGVYMERSLEMIIALLGILKAGGAYVPLDPSYPVERLTFMLEDCRPAIVLTHRSVGTGVSLPKNGRSESEKPLSASLRASVLDLNELWDALSREPVTPPSCEVVPDHLVYVIYTSGSTGQPKGAMNTHRALCNRLHWMQQVYQLTPDDRVLQKTPFSFDVSVWEFFWPLLAGAKLVLARPAGHQDAAYLTALILQERITTLHFVPSMLHIFLQEANLEEQCASVRRVFASGEALSSDLQARFFARFAATETGLASAELHNLYGPTEAAIDVTFWPCQPSHEPGIVPLGHPIANTQIYILDQSMQPMPIGVPGELYIGGTGLARGYYNRPALTAERFIPNPFVSNPGERLYRTGDLTRYQANGTIEYLGRIDQQVKLRGFRIELGEIEATLQSHPGVQGAVVVLHEEEKIGAYLVAYVVPSPLSAPHSDLPPTQEELQSYLRKHLPNYMVPAIFIYLETLPLTPNGKVNRKALPAPARHSKGYTTSGYFVAPQSRLEQLLSEIWQQALDLPQVGVSDNFFDLGGHSLLLIQVRSKLQESLGYEVPVIDLFTYPTIHDLSVHLSQLQEQRPLLQPITERVKKRKESLHRYQIKKRKTER